MVESASQYPIFGTEIDCPHCQQPIPALTLTDTYLCPRHGAFEADPDTRELVHLQSGRHWLLWDGQWYRQHSHPDGIRFEIHEALDRLYGEGRRVTRIVIADRYRVLLASYWQRSNPVPAETPEGDRGRIYGLPVEFSPDASSDPRWGAINFELEHEPGTPLRYPHFRLFA